MIQTKSQSVMFIDNIWYFVVYNILPDVQKIKCGIKFAYAIALKNTHVLLYTTNILILKNVLNVYEIFLARRQAHNNQSFYKTTYNSRV